MHTHQRSRVNQRGAAVVEFALLLPPLVLIAFGITEYGRAFHDYNKIVKSARDAARYLSNATPGDGAAIARAKKLVVFGNTSGSGTPLVTGLTEAKVHVCDSVNSSACADAGKYYLQPTGSGNVNLVAVEVRDVVFTSIVPKEISGLTFGPIKVVMGQVL